MTVFCALSQLAFKIAFERLVTSRDRKKFYGAIAGLVLALMIQSAGGEEQHPPADTAASPNEQPLRRAVAEEAQTRREPEKKPRTAHMSREERLKLRQDVNDAQRDIFVARFPPITKRCLACDKIGR